MFRSRQLRQVGDGPGAYWTAEPEFSTTSPWKRIQAAKAARLLNFNAGCVVDEERLDPPELDEIFEAFPAVNLEGGFNQPNFFEPSLSKALWVAATPAVFNARFPDLLVMVWDAVDWPGLLRYDATKPERPPAKPAQAEARFGQLTKEQQRQLSQRAAYNGWEIQAQTVRGVSQQDFDRLFPAPKASPQPSQPRQPTPSTAPSRQQGWATPANNPGNAGPLGPTRGVLPGSFDTLGPTRERAQEAGFPSLLGPRSNSGQPPAGPTQATQVPSLPRLPAQPSPATSSPSTGLEPSNSVRLHLENLPRERCDQVAAAARAAGIETGVVSDDLVWLATDPGTFQRLFPGLDDWETTNPPGGPWHDRWVASIQSIQADLEREFSGPTGNPTPLLHLRGPILGRQTRPPPNLGR